MLLSFRPSLVPARRFFPTLRHYQPNRNSIAMITIRSMSNDELATLIKSDQQPKKDYLIVDVRDDDFDGGNIKGAINLPSRKFLESVDDLVRDTKDTKKLVFHCALSQVRGPKAARIYAEARQNMLEETELRAEVYVLRGGFTDFQTKYKDDPKLVEKWDKDVWASEWS